MSLLKKVTFRLRNEAFKFVSPILRCWEDRYFYSPNGPAPVFIIGAPRTGSTILYQALTNAYQFAYIDNLACAWYRNLRFGLLRSSQKYGDAPHNNFKAEHGDTKKFGRHAPSECGQFWYRWLPKNRHFIDCDDFTEKVVSDIRKEVLGASAYLAQPLLFKNLNAGQRLRLIHKCFPDAKIIVVRRDPRFVVRSIMRARKAVGVKAGQWWSVMPPNTTDLLKLPEDEMCAAQVYYIEQQIEKDIQLFDPDNLRSVHYQQFNQKLLDDLAEWVGVNRKPNGNIPEFKCDDINSLSIDELNRFSQLVTQYEFKKESFF